MQQAQAAVLERGSAKKREGLDNDFRKKLNLLLLFSKKHKANYVDKK